MVRSARHISDLSEGEMSRVHLVVGIFVLVIGIVDLLWTTLWVDGSAGPLSSRLTTEIWHGVRRIRNQDSRLLSLTGPLITLFSLVMWIGLIWSGWTLIFAGSETTLIDTRDGGPISWTERAYFVAYTLFTMGNGDFTLRDGIWQIATSLTTASGMLFVTMGVTYILSVLGAIVDKRSFASTVIGLGTQSEVMVRTGWDGEDFHKLDLPINTLAPELSRFAKQHRGYPILHYYHSERGEDSSAVAVAVFDEALTILNFGIPEDQQPNNALVKTARSSVQDYLETLNSAFIKPADEAPPPPDLNRLSNADIPTVSDEEFSDTLEDLSKRRRKLFGAVIADEWYWPPVNDE